MRRAWLAFLFLFSLVGIVVGVFGTGLEGGDALWPLGWVLWAPVGYLILVKRPGNMVGTACLSVGCAWAVCFYLLATSLAIQVPEVAAWAELGQLLFGVLPWTGIIWILLVFPSGDFEGRGERATTILAGVFALLGMIGFAIQTTPMEESGMRSPLALDSFQAFSDFVVSSLSFFGILILVFVAIALMITRWRRSDGVERLQYRWLLMGAVVFLVIAVAGQILPEDSPADMLWLLAGSAIPLSIGIAILRYRLYEIDRIISRTVSYALVVGLLAAVYLGALTALTLLLPDQSQLVVAAATLGVAFLFNPLRRRVQEAVDRRFNRSRYDAQRVMDGFAGSLRDQVDSNQVMDGWVGVVSETMQPTSVGVWLRSGASR